MNLITDPWIPVLLQDGTTQHIAPHEITRSENPPIRIHSVRSDFDGALIQFLIGLLQTAATPDTEDAWWDWLETPPSPDTLRQLFSPFEYAFHLDGDGPRFMQEYAPPDINKWKEAEIGYLLPDYPGDQTLEHNKDLFMSRHSVQKTCPSCTATMLYVDALTGLGVGPGYREGLRKAGPVTVCLEGEILWESIWLNVLHRSAYENDGTCPDLTSGWSRFPWTDTNRLSKMDSGEKDSKGNAIMVDAPEIEPPEVHPDHRYWATSHRVRLLPPEILELPEICDVCTHETRTIYREFIRNNHGSKYNASNFRYPLTPYETKKENMLPVATRDVDLDYRLWVRLINGSLIAENIRRFFRLGKTSFESHVGLWVFGYSNKKGSIKDWREVRMPAITSHPTDNEWLEQVDLYIKAAEEALGKLKDCIARAKQKKAPQDNIITKKQGQNNVFLKSPTDVPSQFFRRTQNMFYQIAFRLRTTLHNKQPSTELSKQWIRYLNTIIQDIYNEVIDPLNLTGQTYPESAISSLKQLKNAKFELCETLNINPEELYKS